jgi:hypothetical protein
MTFLLLMSKNSPTNTFVVFYWHFKKWSRHGRDRVLGFTTFSYVDWVAQASIKVKCQLIDT